jgi:hypothetical protein
MEGANMRIIRCVKGIFITYIIISLVGCNKLDNKSVESEATIKISEDAGNISQINNVMHIEDTIEDKIRIDADVYLSKIDGYYQYKVTGKEFDIEKMSNILFENDQSNRNNQKEVHNPYIKAIITTDSGGELVIWPNSLRFHSNPNIESIVYLISSKYRSEIENKDFTNKELQYFILDEHIQNNYEKLKDVYNLGEKEELVLLTAIEVDTKSLIEEQERQSKLPNYEEEVKSGMREVIDNWTETDKFYYLEYKISQNNIPIIGKKEALIQSSVSGISYQSSYLSVLLSEKGIEYLDIQGAWTTTTSEKVNIISAEEGIQKLKEKYANQIVNTESNINKVWIEYIFIPDINYESNSKGTLMPYWCYQSQYDDGVNEDGIKFYTYQADRINAVTGGDLAYGE